MSTNKKQDARRQEILVAALQAFTSKGYDKTSMADIVQVSGLSKGTLYWYFDNKQALFVALIEMIFDGFVTTLDEVIAAMDTQHPEDLIRHIFTRSIEVVHTQPEMTMLTVDFFVQAWQQPEVRSQLTMFYTNYINTVTHIVARGIEIGTFREVDGEDVAATIIGVLDGMALQAMLFDDPDQTIREQRVTKLMNSAADLIITGMCCKEADDGSQST